MVQVQKQTSSGIRMDYLSTLTGDTSLTIDDKDPEKRAELAKHVTELLQKGYAVFVQDGDETFKVKGYDAEENEWILVKRRGGKKKEAVSAEGTIATTIPPRAGG